METVYIDTHVVIWLFMNDKKRFTAQAIGVIEDNELVISPMVIVELGLLYEIKRIKYTPQQIIESLRQSIDLKVSDVSFEKVAFRSTEASWTRDPFDRLITTTAMIENMKLLTKDHMILEHYEHAVW